MGTLSRLTDRLAAVLVLLVVFVIAAREVYELMRPLLPQLVVAAVVVLVVRHLLRSRRRW